MKVIRITIRRWKEELWELGTPVGPNDKDYEEEVTELDMEWPDGETLEIFFYGPDREEGEIIISRNV